MKKAFKSSTVQDQQVVSKNSIPNPVADIYNQSDKPPPLNILTFLLQKLMFVYVEKREEAQRDPEPL